MFEYMCTCVCMWRHDHGHVHMCAQVCACTVAGCEHEHTCVWLCILHMCVHADMPVVFTHTCAGMNMCYRGYVHMYVCPQEGVGLPVCAPLPTPGHPRPQSPEAKNWDHLFCQCVSSNWPNSINTGRTEIFSGSDFHMKKKQQPHKSGQSCGHQSLRIKHTKWLVSPSIYTYLIWDRVEKAMLQKCSLSWSLSSPSMSDLGQQSCSAGP